MDNITNYLIPIIATLATLILLRVMVVGVSYYLKVKAIVDSGTRSPVVVYKTKSFFTLLWDAEVLDLEKAASFMVIKYGWKEEITSLPQHIQTKALAFLFAETLLNRFDKHFANVIIFDKSGNAYIRSLEEHWEIVGEDYLLSKLDWESKNAND